MTKKKKTSICRCDDYTNPLLSTMSICARLVIVCHFFVCSPSPVSAFVERPPFSFNTSAPWRTVATTTAIGLSEKALSEVELLLKKARELRAQAEQQELQVHVELAEKKAAADAHFDGLIDFLFSGHDVVEQLRKKKLSMDTLEKIIERLDERHVAAMGQEHVEAIRLHREGDPIGVEVVEFSRVTSPRDDNEAVYIGALIDCLLEAVSVLDGDLAKKKGGVSNLWKSVTHVESSHWGGGHGAENLRRRLQEKRRERDEQFLERQEELYEAQRVYKKHEPNDSTELPPKPKDDHGFL